MRISESFNANIPSGKEDIHSSVKVDLPDVEAFVIYTGRRRIENDVLSLNQEFSEVIRISRSSRQGLFMEIIKVVLLKNIWDSVVSGMK